MSLSEQLEFSYTFKRYFNEEQLSEIRKCFYLDGQDNVAYAYGLFKTPNEDLETFEIRADYSDDGSVEI